jgi:hypothetical protein
MTSIRLCEQNLVAHFSHPLLTLFSVLLSMIFSTYIATIFDEFASAFLEFDVVHFGNAARSANFGDLIRDFGNATQKVTPRLLFAFIAVVDIICAHRCQCSQRRRRQDKQ